LAGEHMTHLYLSAFGAKGILESMVLFLVAGFTFDCRRDSNIVGGMYYSKN